MRAAVAGLTFFLVFLVGCATAPVDTPNKRLAQAEITFVAVVSATIAAVENGQLPKDSESARLALSAINAGSASLDAAYAALANGQLDDFTARLAMVQGTIAALRSILTAVGAKTP
jgi:hypothetical protein